MWIYDIMAGISLFAGIYYEYEYWEGRAEEERKEKDPIRRFHNFSERIKPVTIIFCATIYFIIRLKVVW